MFLDDFLCQHFSRMHYAYSRVQSLFGRVAVRLLLSLRTSPKLSNSNILDLLMADTNDSIEIEIENPRLERLKIMLRSLAHDSHKNSKALANLQRQRSVTDSRN